MSNILDSIRAQYEKNKNEQASSGSGSPDFSMYFSARLEDNERNGEQTVRIMPTKDGKSPFEEGHWHSIEVDGKWKKLYCNKHNDGGECPLCEIEKQLKSTGSKEDLKLSRKYRARKFYIVKLIDRDNEQDGVKFWRFSDNYKGEGPFDKILPIFTKRGDITHPREGRDLNIILGRDDKNYTKITSIMAEDVGLLTEDTDKAKKWMSDDRTWKDIYKSQPMEYLQIVSNGETPVWDKGLEKFVSKDGDTSESEYNYSNNTSSNTNTFVNETNKNTPPSTINDDDELPF